MRRALQLASGLDTQSALSRLKAQGQEFSRLYGEFVFYRDFALSNPMTAQKWIAINRFAIATQKILAGANSQLDAVNHIAEMMFGKSLLDTAPNISNLYLMSGNAALAYIILELKKFNAALNRIAIQQVNENDQQGH